MAAEDTQPKPAPALPVDPVDEFAAAVKRIDEANAALYGKYRKSTDDFQKKMEALTSTTLATFPVFRPYADLGPVIRAFKSSEPDRVFITEYLRAIESKPAAEAAALRAKLRALLPTSTAG